MLLGLGLILLLVLATAFFVASEFALVGVRRTRVEQLIGEGRPGAKQIKYALDNLPTFLAAAQVGITMASLGLGALGEPVLSQFIEPVLEAILPREFVEQFVSFHGISFIIAFVIVTIVELVLGETVPKIYALQRSEKTSLLIIGPLRLCVFLFMPLVWIINLLSNAILRLLGLDPKDEHASVHSVEELEMLVTSSRQAGVLEEDEEAILRRVFDLSDLSARQVMVPRTEVVGIHVDATAAEVIETVGREKHSRYPVYEDDLDSILGALHVKDVFLALANGLSEGAEKSGIAQSDFRAKDLMRDILNVPETLSVNDLLAQMQQSRVHIAVAIDEYGGTAGIVTLEDILEEIVGEVRDEFEGKEEQPDFLITSEGTLVHGLTSIDDVNEQLGLDIHADSETLGGYVFELLGRKPEVGDEVKVDSHRLRVEELDGLRIAEVRVLPAAKVQTVPARDDE